MVDLAGQHGRIQVELDAALLSAANAGAYIQGPEVKTFATELANYLDVAHVIPCANGTDALQIALMALGLKPGDEVITATFTYVASITNVMPCSVTLQHKVTVFAAIVVPNPMCIK